MSANYCERHSIEFQNFDCPLCEISKRLEVIEKWKDAIKYLPHQATSYLVAKNFEAENAELKATIQKYIQQTLDMKMMETELDKYKKLVEKIDTEIKKVDKSAIPIMWYEWQELKSECGIKED